MGPELMQLILAIVGLIAGYLGRRYTEPEPVKLPEGITPTMLAQLGKVTAAKQEREAVATLHECVKCLKEPTP